MSNLYCTLIFPWFSSFFNGHFRNINWRYLPYKAYVRAMVQGIYTQISGLKWYSSFILGSRNSHWSSFWQNNVQTIPKMAGNTWWCWENNRKNHGFPHDFPMVSYATPVPYPAYPSVIVGAGATSGRTQPCWADAGAISPPALGGFSHFFWEDFPLLVGGFSMFFFFCFFLRGCSNFCLWIVIFFGGRMFQFVLKSFQFFVSIFHFLLMDLPWLSMDFPIQISIVGGVSMGISMVRYAMDLQWDLH